MSETVVCRHCGHVGPDTKKTPGSFVLELLLWLCFLLPGFIYSIWRHAARHRACEKCGSKEILPADTPMGRKLVKEMSGSA